MCWYHYSVIGQTFIEHRSIFGSRFRAASAELKAKSVEIHGGRTHVPTRREASRAASERQSVVYYVRIHDRVKIGYTGNLKQRLSGLRVDPDALLATEPGGREQEAIRHAQFADERYGKREDFNPSRRLLEHIAQVKTLHGDPVLTTHPQLG